MSRRSTMSIKEMRRWKWELYLRGVMPWNWRNNDIWTAYVMVSRELAAAEKENEIADWITKNRPR